VHARIQFLNEEVAVTMNLLEQQEKFDQIQQANNELYALFEAQSIAKKELCKFRPIVQIMYIKMHQVDATNDYEWNSLDTSNPKGCIPGVTQDFVVEASLLSRK
jgi:septation ring formation regulator EzrA